MSKTKHVEKTIEWAKKKGFSNIKTDLVDGFEKPFNFTRSSDSLSFSPDLTALNGNNKKHYFHIVQKKEEDTNMFTQIELFHTLAKAKNTKLYLMAPTGNLKYARDLSNKLELAEVVRI
ncbi:hypothetical protein [Lacihabitans lacunae]|jgi:hypothetical protein|uniref:Restriction endonuclease type IV Mrr domain-containing protein n=1 Tax=Lacihabitans lacunae TaxID=1028214 RepID=A0ABV7YXX8_9BACT